MFGIAIDNLRFEDLVVRIRERVASREPGYIVTPNVDHICRLQHDADFQAAYADASMTLADGMPIMWAGRLLGCPLQEKLSGSDMVPRLSAEAERLGLSVFLLGAAPGVGDEAAAVLRTRFPKLDIRGVYSPPLGFEQDPFELETMIAAVRKAAPDICFVALGSPKQEIVIHQHHAAMQVPVTLGIGAGLDFVAGRVKRAPRWMQRVGLEWLWRVCQEPRRLARRYFIDDTVFFGLLVREWLGRRSRT
jgi:N-acetylglucosaminyldiphosphoundecaprenol N-acetyl-beta-D-mannosaminyltransferase